MYMLTGFRDFLMRGNVVDLAVGIVIGAAFGTVVSALVKDLLTPLIAALFTAPDFSKMVFTINGSGIMYGDFINALISFLIAAASIYFFVVLPMNKVMAKMKKPEAPVASGPTPDQKLLMEIRDALLKRS
jgi:large conductance mechanosensitive channel